MIMAPLHQVNHAIETSAIRLGNTRSKELQWLKANVSDLPKVASLNQLLRRCHVLAQRDTDVDAGETLQSRFVLEAKDV